jgi:protein-tyrosine phosphatase
MAKGILEDFSLNHPVEVQAKGLVVLFPEPINQKAEAILISNGIHMDGFTSVQFTEEDLTSDTLVLTMERVQKERLLELYGIDKEEDIYVLTELVGDELEILDPYGGTLTSYGLCYETLRKSIKKLVKLLNEGE